MVIKTVSTITITNSNGLKELVKFECKSITIPDRIGIQVLEITKAIEILVQTGLIG